MSEIRYDQIYDNHVIIAPERLHRPDVLHQSEREHSPSDACPFCEGNEAMTPPEIYARRDRESFPNEQGWHTRVVPNLYKAVQIEAAHRFEYRGLFNRWEGFGAHEVIIDTPTHHLSMTQWSEQEIREWLKTMRQRVMDLRRDGRIVYLSLFKNEGILAGATQTHPHTQLIALPMVPAAERDRYRRGYEHYTSTGRSLMESLILQEESEGERIVARRGDFVAYCPYASAYPFEVMISSSQNMGQIDTLSDRSVGIVAQLLQSVFERLERQLGTFDFNLQVATPPLQPCSTSDRELYQLNAACRFFIRIMPRLYRHGGFEASTGMIINPVAPEMAAKLLREYWYE